MAKNLAVALAVSKKKKNQSAKSESRPSTQERDNDSKDVSQNSGDKASKNDSWTDQSTLAEARSTPKPKLMPISATKMADSSVIHAYKIDSLGRRLDQMEKHLQSSTGVNDGPEIQPPKSDDESGADRSGPSVPALKMKLMAKGGKINDFESVSSAENDSLEEPTGIESDNDQEGPKSSEYMAGYMAAHQKYSKGGGVNGDTPVSAVFEHERPDEQLETGADQNEEDSDIQMAAEGGKIDLDDEESEERHDSIAAAIMAKRNRERPGSDSGSIDEEDAERDMYADGGEVDLSRNADEDPNEEDQESFQALKKENYSESEGLDQLEDPDDSNEHGDEREDESENKRDRVGIIRKRMNMKRQFGSR